MRLFSLRPGAQPIMLSSPRAKHKGPKGQCAESARALVAGAWTERKKMYHGGSFLKLADDNMDIQNPEAQNRELSGF